MAVLFIDLDRFKIVNDSLGHDAGDRAAHGRRPAGATVRPATLVARLAGDEFVVIMRGPGRDRRSPMAERIVAVLSEPITFAPRRRTATSASAPASASRSPRQAPGRRRRPAARRRRRDVPGQAARPGPGGDLRPGHGDAIERRLETPDDLRHGDSRTDQLHVYYQPIVDPPTGRVVGFEALVRWQHPTRGLIAPATFIPLAEETGLIVPLGAAVLPQACQQAAEWRVTPGAPTCISPSTSSGPSSSTRVRHRPSPRRSPTTGLDPGALWLEITETSIMADAAPTRATLDRCGRSACTSPSTTSALATRRWRYLRRFPVDVLKIDRSFVDRARRRAGGGGRSSP